MCTREPDGSEKWTPRADAVSTSGALDLIHIWLDLECGTTGAEGMIVRVKQPGCVHERPFLLIREPEGYEVYARKGQFLTERAGFSLAPGRPAWDEVLALLGADGVDRGQCGRFRVCYFAEMPPAQDYSLVSERSGQFVVMAGGQIIARAISVRRNASGAEVWVETKAGYRRRGYGRQVCSAWGQRQLGQGRVGFYCYAWDNVASKALAESLGLAILADGLWR